MFGTISDCRVSFIGTYRVVVCYGLSVLEACVVDPAFSNMAVFHNINNSNRRYSATLASFPGEGVGEEIHDPVSCVVFMCC